MSKILPGGDGPPSPSRDRDGIGRRDKNIAGLLHSIFSVTEGLILKSSKPGLGQGIMGDLVLSNGKEGKFGSALLGEFSLK